MTAINTATDIPSNIVTLEQLAVWCDNCLSALNPSLSVVEGENYSQRAASTGTYYIASTNKYRHVGRVSVEMDIRHLYDAGKPWLYALPLSDAALNPLMKVN